MNYGLTENQLKSIVENELNKNPDLQYYINDPYIEELIQVLIDGIVKAIEANTLEMMERIKNDFRR